MTLELCEVQLAALLAALDALGAGASRSACYIAMALDSIGDALSDANPIDIGGERPGAS